MSWLDHLVRARRHLAASGLSPRVVTMLLALWVDQVEREGRGEPPEGVTLRDWVLWIVAPLESTKILRSGRVVRERHPDRPQTYRLVMPRSFHGVRRPVDDSESF